MNQISQNYLKDPVLNQGKKIIWNILKNVVSKIKEYDFFTFNCKLKKLNADNFLYSIRPVRLTEYKPDVILVGSNFFYFQISWKLKYNSSWVCTFCYSVYNLYDISYITNRPKELFENWSYLKIVFNQLSAWFFPKLPYCTLKIWT